MKPPAVSTAELYQQLQTALTDTMTAAGWLVDPDEPLGPDKSMVAAFRRPISAGFSVAAFFDRAVMIVAANRDFGRLSVTAWLGVLYEPASRLWPLVFAETPTPLLAVEARNLDDPSQSGPVHVTGLRDLPAAVDTLAGPVLRHGVAYAERVASIDQLEAALRADKGWGPQFLPVVLAAAGDIEKAHAALDELGPRGDRSKDRLDIEAAGRLRRWIDEGAVLPDTITSPPVVERRRFSCEDDDHSGCPHVQFSTAVQVLPAGVRMVYPGRPTLDFTLCRCACHADCSLADQPDGVGWPEGCSCNKTLKMREEARHHPPSDEGIDLLGSVGKGFAQARRQRSARRAAAARAKGRSKEEIGTIIDEEWSRHGLELPTGATQKWEISRITNPPNTIDQTVTTAKFFKDLIGAPFRFRDAVRSRHQLVDQEQEQTYEVATGRRDLIEVPVEERARTRLGHVVDEGILTPSLAKLFTVEVRSGHDNAVELWYRPSPDSPAEPLASLAPPDSDRFRRPLAAATRVGQRCTSKAFCFKDSNGQWSVGLSLPLRADPNAGSDPP